METNSHNARGRGRPPLSDGVRQRLLSQARELLRSGEQEKLPIRQLAASAGVSTGSFYKFFPDQHALREALAMDVYAELALILDRALTAAEGKSVFDRVMRMAVSYVDYVQANEKLWANLLEFRRQYRDSNALAVEAENALFGVLESELEKLDGVDKPDLCADLARALWASVHGITVQTVPNSFKDDPRGDALEQMRLIIDAVITRYSS